MKYLYLIFILVGPLKVAAQLPQPPQIATDMPKIAPPAPTVAGLMKFEEVPVSNYTGVPDISIPLFSVGSHSKDIALNLSMKYHPGSTAAEEVAGFTGLGWNLMAGGSISRTVRGYPDEIQQGAGTNVSAMYGIHTQGVVTYSNNYYQIQDFLGPGMTPGQAMIFSEFLWESFEKGRYDTEHDLYQYNFMGHSGRFYLSYKNSVYQVVKLDNDNAMKIQYNPGNKSFTLWDDKGYQYTFDIKEETTQTSTTSTTYFDNTGGLSNPTSYSYTSAFHLSAVHDATSQLLIAFDYNPVSEPIREKSGSSSTVTSYFIGTNASDVVTLLNSRCGQVSRLQPQNSLNLDSRVTLTRKIRQIRVIDKAKIDFVLEAGRQDTDNVGNYRLKQVVVKDWLDVGIKKFDFSYTNSDLNNRSRMLLSQVAVSNFTNTQKEVYGLSYVAPYGGSAQPVDIDYWGFYNRRPVGFAGRYREPDPKMSRVDVLQKMTLPSGGAMVFNFESNTYSHIGSEPLTNYDGNPDNFEEVEEYYTLTSGTRPDCQIVTMLNRNMDIVSFKVQVQSPLMGTGADITDMVYMTHNGTSMGNVGCYSSNPNCFYNFTWVPGDYSICFINYVFTETKTATVKITKRYRKRTIKEFVYGGGLRIGAIGYFENSNVPQEYYDMPGGPEVPSKQKNYTYTMPQNPGQSSGALVFAKPIYEYTQNKHYEINCTANSGLPLYFNYDYSFRIVTSFNNLKALRTQGSDVGYSNVAVSETGNGISRYVYTSPKDNPEPSYDLSYPFMPSANYDYKRGLLKNEQHFRQDGTVLSESQYDYDIAEGTIVSGMKIFSHDNCRYSYRYTNHLSYYTAVQQCAGACTTVCGYPISYIGYVDVYENFGWAKLIQKKSFEYLQGNTLSTTENFTYNMANKKIASHTVTNSQNETLKTQYTYDNTNPYFGQNRISDISRIDTYRNNELLTSSKVNYLATGGNVSTIETAKGNQALESRVRYDLYDEFSNPLEVFQEQGMHTCYVWGYNKTQIIAKIENVTYLDITLSLVTAAQNASNTAGATGLEVALTNLRTSLPNAMVTTYTYKPMVGVSTITDPKGDKVSYTYDAFGRLSTVRDKNNNILSINDYHYRTQN